MRAKKPLLLNPQKNVYDYGKYQSEEPGWKTQEFLSHSNFTVSTFRTQNRIMERHEHRSLYSHTYSALFEKLLWMIPLFTLFLMEAWQAIAMHKYLHRNRAQFLTEKDTTVLEGKKTCNSIKVTKLPSIAKYKVSGKTTRLFTIKTSYQPKS